jgi:hypothetical protein
MAYCESYFFKETVKAIRWVTAAVDVAHTWVIFANLDKKRGVRRVENGNRYKGNRVLQERKMERFLVQSATGLMGSFLWHVLEGRRRRCGGLWYGLSAASSRSTLRVRTRPLSAWAPCRFWGEGGIGGTLHADWCWSRLARRAAASVGAYSEKNEAKNYSGLKMSKSEHGFSRLWYVPFLCSVSIALVLFVVAIG